MKKLRRQRLRELLIINAKYYNSRILKTEFEEAERLFKFLVGVQDAASVLRDLDIKYIRNEVGIITEIKVEDDCHILVDCFPIPEE